jgi:hypothetical protein
MPFDLSTAKPDAVGFDISTARPDEPALMKPFQGVPGGEDVRSLLENLTATPAKILDAASLGNFSKYLPKATGVYYPEYSKDFPAKGAMNLASNVAGFTANPLIRMGGEAALAGNATKAAALGGIAGALSASETNQGRVVNTLAGAGLGAAGAGISKAGQALKQAGTEAGQVKFAEGIRSKLFEAKEGATKKFGKALEGLSQKHPEKMVSLRNVVDQARAESVYEPNLNSAINRIPALKTLVENPELANNVTLKEAQHIINNLNTKLPRQIGFNDIPVADLRTDIRAAQLEAFPEMSKVRGDYAAIKKNYDLIKGRIKEGGLVNSLKTKFGDPEKNTAFKKLVDKDTVKAVDSFRRSSKALRASGLGAKGYALYELYRHSPLHGD